MKKPLPATEAALWVTDEWRALQGAGPFVPGEWILRLLKGQRSSPTSVVCSHFHRARGGYNACLYLLGVGSDFPTGSSTEFSDSHHTEKQDRAHS